MKKTKVKFMVLEIVDPPKQGSEIAIGNVFDGESDGNGRVYYTDKTDTNWVFWIGDTCEIVE